MAIVTNTFLNVGFCDMKFVIENRLSHKKKSVLCSKVPMCFISQDCVEYVNLTKYCVS